MDHRLLSCLPHVAKPGRYTNSELNAVHKDWRQAKIKVALAFPDIYDLGMSYLGYKILYALINQREDALAERVYAPWIDLQDKMRKAKIPLTSLESGRELTEFDFLGFTLQYELSYTNILHMLDLAFIPRFSAERKEQHPLVMAGGPCAFNPEPLADFLDFVVLGEGEEVMEEILDLGVRGREQGLPRAELLSLLAELEGIYVPSFYQPVYSVDGAFQRLEPLREKAPLTITKRVVSDLNQAFFPKETVVPFVEVVHDRLVAEIMRGCTRGCRFCQAGMLYRPVRERKPALLEEQISNLLASTGYEEISLSSLSSGDYSKIRALVKKLIAAHYKTGVSVSLPSLRVDSFSVEVAQEIQKSRKTGLTFAPEAGTQRLRNVINKNVSETELWEAVKGAFAAGWYSLKLYFMIGLPTETQADLEGILDLAGRALQLGREYATGRKRPELTISVASFVPKPHTPFQWEAQDSKDTLRLKLNYLRKNLKQPGMRLSYAQVEESFLEAVFARGDRRLAAVLNRAADLGCRFDSWSDCLCFELWEQAFKETGLDPVQYAEYSRDPEENLPWDHLKTGVEKEFLLRERELASKAKLTPDCRWSCCSQCGVCPNLRVTNLLAEEKARG